MLSGREESDCGCQGSSPKVREILGSVLLISVGMEGG